MAINKAYLTSNKTAEGDEVYTPYYAVDPLSKLEIRHLEKYNRPLR